jgi:hypothetical protein
MVPFLTRECPIGPFLLLERRMHRPPTSAVGFAFGNGHLAVLVHNKSKEGVLETHAMATIDQSAVRNTFSNLEPKVAEHR